MFICNSQYYFNKVLHTLLIAVLLAAVPLLVGCSKEKTINTSTSEQAQTVLLDNYSSSNKAIKCNYPVKPKRVVAIGEAAAETLLQLKQGDRLVAIVDAVEDGAEIKELYPDFNKDGHCAFLNRPSVETLLALKPDLIIGWYQNFTPKRYNTTDFWNQRQVKTYIPASSTLLFQKKNVEMELTFVEDMGKVFACSEVTDRFVQEQRASIRRAAEAMKQPRPRAMVLALSRDLIINYGEVSLPGDIVTQAGGTIVAPKERYISAEDLIRINPDIVFIIRLDRNLDKGPELFAANPKFRSLDCVAKGNVHGIPVHWMYNSGINIGKAVETVAAKLKLAAQTPNSIRNIGKI